ncbi:DUF4157 domain-containing protein [Agromyces sp. Leaf222]|uniref:eCIS core domain-containing protein n=1 Tax=Agromyces sp. Leaf222 TaxID=1735688 RepID=UPI0006FC70FF|nr:DUF4157 domain-containing protein [Agromyces sp. Leaf222]KQM82333.1 hypothetical protein ASE68_02755 [Agromyces sp. Leaf222]
MHAHDYDGIDLDVGRRAAESARESDVKTAGLAERRPDVLGPAGIMRLQREAGNGAVSELVEEQRSPVLDVVGSSGAPLEPGLRTDMESRLGADFGDVRVHTDAAAHDSAKSVGANAYTVGSNVVFQRDAYDPGSTAGQTTLAHELTHVVQQRSGPVEGTPSAGGVSVSDPGDRFERAASENAARVMSEPAPVQRHAEGEEEEAPVQGSFVQREEAAEEEEEAAG